MQKIVGLVRYVALAFILPLAVACQPNEPPYVETPQPEPAATVALTDATPTAEQFFYILSEGVSLSTFGSVGPDQPTWTVMIPQRREFWIRADGAGRIRQHAIGVPQFLSPQDQAAWQAAGRPKLTVATNLDEQFKPGDLFRGETQDLPSDVPTLTQLVHERAARTGNPLNAEMFEVVATLLREMPLSLAQRRALFEVGAAIPGVEQDGQAQDQRGRPGVSLSYTSGMSGLLTRKTLIFDAATFHLLGEQQMLLQPSPALNIPTPALTGWVVYLVSGNVASVEETPETPFIEQGTSP